MLNNTYIHIPCIGASTERMIWKSGIKSWDDFLINHGMLKATKKKQRVLYSGVEESIEQLSGKNHVFLHAGSCPVITGGRTGNLKIKPHL